MNLMLNNFLKTAEVKTIYRYIYELKTKVSLLRILLKKLRALHAVEDLKPLLKISYTFFCKKVPGKITDKQRYGK